VRSDVERKRLYDLAAGERTNAGVGCAIYELDATQRTYLRLRELARAILDANFPAVIDAAFLRRADRDAFRALARELGVSFAIAACEAPQAMLYERIASRTRAAVDASEATLEVLAHQLATTEPIASEERTFAVVIDTQDRLENLRKRAVALGSQLGVGPWQPSATRIA
jgi:predicted kinase